MEFLLIIVSVVVFVSCIYVIVSNRSWEKRVQSDDAYHLRFLSLNNVIRSREFIYNDPVEQHYFWFIADDTNKNIHIATEKTPKIFKTISYKNIIGIKIEEDSEIFGELSKAIVGGVLAGSVGAAVGFYSGKPQVTSYKIIFELNDIYEPKYEIVLIDKHTKTDSLNFKKTLEFAENVISVVKVIVYRNA